MRYGMLRLRFALYVERTLLNWLSSSCRRRALPNGAISRRVPAHVGTDSDAGCRRRKPEHNTMFVRLRATTASEKHVFLNETVVDSKREREYRNEMNSISCDTMPLESMTEHFMYKIRVAPSEVSKSTRYYYSTSKFRQIHSDLFVQPTTGTHLRSR